MIIDETRPYPWPYDRCLTLASMTLVLCGTGPHWTGRTPVDESALANLTALRDLAADIELPTVLVNHQPSTSRPVRGLPSRPCRALHPESGEHVVTAAGTDGFYGSSLDRLLHRAGRTHLLLAGFGFETAVHSTLRRANDRGYECLTVADACLTIDDSLRAASISSIEFSGGIFGAVGRTDNVITAIRAAANPSNCASAGHRTGTRASTTPTKDQETSS